jgi:hypothetical protein
MNIKETVLPLHFRYVGAWSEINVRIQLRQNALTAYTSWCLAMLGFVASTKGVDLHRFLYVLPFLSLFFVFLVRMHEEMIENLYQFLRRAEFLDSMDGRMAAAFPSYHWDEFHRSIAIKSRNFNDIVIIGLIIMVHTVASFMILKKINILSEIDYFLIVVSILIFFYTLWLGFNLKYIKESNLDLNAKHYTMIKNRKNSDLPEDKIWNTNEDRLFK